MNAVAQTDASQHLQSDLYSFLSMTMRPPSAEFLDDDYFDAFDTLLSTLGLETERATAHGWRDEGVTPLRTLTAEYVRLFEGAKTPPLVPLEGSAWMGGADAQTKSADETRQFYRAHGFDLRPEASPPDHIQYELEFLAVLTRKGDLDAEAEFLKSYFRPWFGVFRDEALQKVSHPFYRVALELIHFYTKEEEQ